MYLEEEKLVGIPCILHFCFWRPYLHASGGVHFLLLRLRLRLPLRLLLIFLHLLLVACHSRDRMREAVVVSIMIWAWVEIVKGSPLQDLVSSLPGQPVDGPVSFRQFSGYVNVANRSRHLFYYFVEAQQLQHHHSSKLLSPTSLPLTLWLNGGPGCSSVGGGAFTELGPFYPNSKADGLLVNPHSWNKVSNVLFLESPAGVGFSYSDNASDYYYDDAKVANDNLEFLLGWFIKFPEYQNSDFYLTGESYAGHYIPQLADLILRYNQGSSGFKFKLRGVAIGNPLLNYGLDTEATYAFLWSHGLISDHTYGGIHNTCDFSTGYPRRTSATQGQGCSSFLQRGDQEIGNDIDIYDVTLDVCMPPIVMQQIRLKSAMMFGDNKAKEVDVCIDDEISRYLNTEEVQSSLHVNSSRLTCPWQACSRLVKYVFEDQLQDMLPVLKRLLKEGLRVWIFSGDQDSVVPLTGTRTQMEALARSINMPTTVSYGAWYADAQVGGWTQSYGNLTYATVRGASHMVPYAQPMRALVLFRSFINGVQLPQQKSR